MEKIMFDIFIFLLLIIGFFCFIRGGVMLWRRGSLGDKEHATSLFVTSALFFIFAGAVIARLCGLEI